MNARNLKAVILRKLDRNQEASEILRSIRLLDLLDIFSRFLVFGDSPADGQQRLDLTFDLLRAGLLSVNDIAFLKCDYNRTWSEPGWPAVAPDVQKKVYVDFIRNLYSILAELRAKHSNVEIESCSGGGSRVDLGIMKFTDEVWPSDNTDAYDRLLIQNGFTYAYTPGVMMAWVTDSPTWVNQRTFSLEYRFLSSMQDSLGIGANLNKWIVEDFATAKKMVTQYKAIREIVQRGSLYCLITPENNSEQSVTESVSRDNKQAVTFAFLHSSRELYPFPCIYLRGLDAGATYRLSTLDGKLAADTPGSASGAYWMQRGVDIELPGDFQAAVFTLGQVEGTATRKYTHTPLESE